MKRKITLILLLIIICTLVAGCAGGGESQKEEREAVQVDVDLTVLSETVLSAELMHIILNSDDYVGKTIRVRGTYYSLFHEASGEFYHYVITKQGDECCQEGLEFVWNGDHTFPDDYPEMGTPIELYGVFSRYQGEGIRFFYLAVDDISIL